MYIAAIHKDPDSCFGVSFPDLLGCISAGDTMEEARKNAIEAVSLHLSGMNQDKEAIPAPRTLDQLYEDAKSDGDLAEELEGAVLVDVPHVTELGKVSRINITIDAGLLAAIDSEASNRGLNRSAFLSDAAKKSLAG